MSNQFTDPWEQEEIEYLKDNIKKLTYKQMGEVLNRTSSSIQSKIRYLPFNARVRKHRMNFDFFKTLSPKAAYVLGFIAADGNICHSGRAHTLHIASDDKDIVEKIKTVMGYGGPVYEKSRSNGKTSYSLRVCDKTVFEDLQKLGVTERKSFTICPPKLDKKLESHFIRGYFDGDGSVFSLNNPKYPSHYLGVHIYTASLKMAKYLYVALKNLLGNSYRGRVRNYFVHQKTSYYVLSFGSRQSKRLFEYMYEDSEGLYINRKYNRFMYGIKHVA